MKTCPNCGTEMTTTFKQTDWDEVFPPHSKWGKACRRVMTMPYQGLKLHECPCCGRKECERA